MPYESIPGVGATYLDGAFASPAVSTQPKIIIIGTASTGLSYRLYNVRSVAAAEKEFGATSEMMKPLHEAIAQGADNVALLRCGGKKGSVNIVETGGGTLYIEPEYRDDTILDRYTCVVTKNAEDLVRVLIWDLTDEAWVYDSDEVLVVNIGIIKVTFTNLGSTKWNNTHLCGDINNPDDTALTPTLTNLVTEANWTVDATPSFTTDTATAGTDGTSMSLVERYAALEHAYGILDYRDGDYIIPCGITADARNLTDTDDYSHWPSGAGPVRTGSSFTSVPTAGETTGSNIDQLGFLWQYQYRGKVYTYFLNTANPATATSLTHAQLTGDTVPAAVTAKFAAATAAEVRECSFAHQLASFCYRASTVWKSMLGFISIDGPAAYDRSTIAEWAGQLPKLTYFGTDLGIDATADNGDGVLGNKFIGGASYYRDGVLDASTGATTSDGLAYGGFILTKGESLPNGTDFVYGINDNDEALDANDKPIDIGKHLFMTYEHPVHRNSYNGGTNYRGNFVGTLAGKFAVTPENEEPIGINGRVRRISSPLRIKPPQMNELARARTIGVRREDGVGFIIVSCRTAAHPTSDYTRLSTIRSVNREIDGIRDIAKNYIGKEFSSTRLMSLQTAIDGFLKAERALGFNQGAIASLSYTRADKIMGRLTIKLKMIPPFSIEAITIETSLAAEETELTS